MTGNPDMDKHVRVLQAEIGPASSPWLPRQGVWRVWPRNSTWQDSKVLQQYALRSGSERSSASVPTMRDGSFEQHGQAFGGVFQRGNMQRYGRTRFRIHEMKSLKTIMYSKSKARLHSVIATSMFYLALELPLAPRLCSLLRLGTVKSCTRA